MLNPVWLNTFVTVAQSRSLSHAGRALGLAQSSVSDHIRRLEQHLGKRLFVRDTHSLAMTDDGDALLVHAQLILEALARAESQFTLPRLRGLVRLGTSDDVSQSGLPNVLAQFRASHPDVELQITIGMSDRLYRLMDEGDLDLMICKRRADQRRGTLLFRSQLQWLARPGTVVDAQRPLPLALVAEPSVTRGIILDTLARAGWQWQVLCTSSSHSGCVAAARGGLGVMARADYLAGRDLVPPINVEALPKLPEVETVFLAARRLSLPAQTLLDLIKASDLRRSD